MVKNPLLIVKIAIGLIVVSAISPSLAQKRKNKKITIERCDDTLSENTKERYNYFFVEASRQQSLGKYDRAFDLLNHAISLNPNGPEAYYNRAMYFSSLKNDSLALADLLTAARLNPENTTYQERIAQYYLGSQKYDQAIVAYEALYEHTRDNLEALQILLQLYQQNKDYNKMIKTIDRLEVLEGESEKTALSKVSIYEMKGDKKAAYKELKSLTNHHPLDASYKIKLGNWLIQNKKQKEGLKYFKEVLKEEPDNNDAQVSLHYYYQVTHQDSLANQLLHKILLSSKTSMQTKAIMMRSFIQENEQRGGDSTVVLNLFNKVLASPQTDAGMAELKAAYMTVKHMPTDSINQAYRQVLQIAPYNANARLSIIQNLWADKKYDSVIEMCKPAQEYNPDEMAFYYFEGLAYYQKEDNDAALSAFKRGVSQINAQSNAEMVSDFYALMGDILQQKGNTNEAYAAYDSCLQWKDDNIGCLNNYAYYLSLENKNLSKAEQMSYKTVKAEPKNSTYLDTYAWILFMEKRYSEAKIYIDQAMNNMDSISSNNVIPEHAGDIYFMMGETDKAVGYWKKALDMGNKSTILPKKVLYKKYLKE